MGKFAVLPWLESWPIWNWLIFVVLVAVPLYFVPSIVAYARHHHNRLAILFLNIFLGWTFLGWVAALVWAGTYVMAEQLATAHPVVRREPTIGESADRHS
ncbi:MAG TPA: superinfection immunity protein [Burkholderiales bacterium]|nr:superinfection immunity protein [Burkholderiales bacterium]